MNDPIDAILARLEKVTQKGKDKWSASCPAHDDKNPSLSVGRGNNGCVLLKCWAGCSAADVVDAMGLTMADLFPQSEQHHTRPGRQRIYPDYRMILRMISHELTVIVIAADRICGGRKIDDHDLDLVSRSASNIRRTLEIANV